MTQSFIELEDEYLKQEVKLHHARTDIETLVKALRHICDVRDQIHALWICQNTAREALREVGRA
jgi:hypothetical protein